MMKIRHSTMVNFTFGFSLRNVTRNSLTLSFATSVHQPLDLHELRDAVAVADQEVDNVVADPLAVDVEGHADLRLPGQDVLGLQPEVERGRELGLLLGVVGPAVVLGAPRVEAEAAGGSDCCQVGLR